MSVSKHVNYVEKPIPKLKGYFARTDGTIRTPAGNVLRGHVGNRYGHLRIRVAERHFEWVHRLIGFTFVKNPRPDIFGIIDHINQNEQDNRPDNLRWVNKQINGLNNCTRGASFVKHFWKNGRRYPLNKWRARVNISRKTHSLGFYKTFLEAYRVSQKYKQDAITRIYDELTLIKRHETPRTGRYILGI